MSLQAERNVNPTRNCRELNSENPSWRHWKCETLESCPPYTHNTANHENILILIFHIIRLFIIVFINPKPLLLKIDVKIKWK